MFRYLRSFSIYIFNLYFSLSFLKYNFELHSFEFWIPKFISILNFFWISRKRIESFWIWKWHLIGLRLVRSISSLIEEFDEWNFMECNPIIVNTQLNRDSRPWPDGILVSSGKAFPRDAQNTSYPRDTLDASAPLFFPVESAAIYCFSSKQKTFYLSFSRRTTSNEKRNEIQFLQPHNGSVQKLCLRKELTSILFFFFFYFKIEKLNTKI